MLVYHCLGFPDSSVSKESCNAGDPNLIPGSGRSTGEGIGYPLQYSWALLVAQLVKNPAQHGRTGFHPWFGKIPWRRERLPTPVFQPGEFHGLYSSWGCKELDMMVTFTSLQALILCLNGYLLLALWALSSRVLVSAVRWRGIEICFLFCFFFLIYVYFRSSGHRWVADHQPGAPLWCRLVKCCSAGSAFSKALMSSWGYVATSG